MAKDARNLMTAAVAATLFTGRPALAADDDVTTIILHLNDAAHLPPAQLA